MLHNYSDEQLRLAARLYYLDGLPQAEVARFTNVSQAKVSRLLSLARERGIVRITVEDYQPRNVSLEKELKKGFCLSTVAVIKTAEDLSLEDLRRAVGHFAGSFIDSMIEAHSTVTISGGRTMRELVQSLPQAPARQLTVVQAMGSVDSSVSPVDSLELGRTLAHRFGGTFLTINTPAFVPDKKTRDAFLQLEQIQNVRRRLSKVDVALVGIGTLQNSVFAERGVLGRKDVADLKAAGAVGEMCGRFFDANGRECDTQWRDRVISIELEQLRKIPQVVGVIAGSDRCDAIRAAVKGKLLKSLVIDEAGARALLGKTI
ncbi:MAG: sugar-binding transcriptional regulator [Verrucomicrobia bacterium]|nr:sugar-binding transcriptional regulator [Verrucomicrobiota bacterium]